MRLATLPTNSMKVYMHETSKYIQTPCGRTTKEHRHLFTMLTLCAGKTSQAQQAGNSPRRTHLVDGFLVLLALPASNGCLERTPHHWNTNSTTASIRSAEGLIVPRGTQRSKPANQGIPARTSQPGRQHRKNGGRTVYRRSTDPGGHAYHQAQGHGAKPCMPTLTGC